MNGRWPGIGVSRAAAALWTPADLGARLWGWFKPDPLTVNHTADRVSEWRSAVGANKVEQASGSRQPLFTSGVSIHFDIGANNQFMASPARAFSTSEVRTVAAVTQWSALASNVVVDMDANFSTGMCSIAEPNNGGRRVVEAFSRGRVEANNAAAGANQKHLSLGVATATQVISRLNGGTPVTAASTGLPIVGSTTAGFTINSFAKADPTSAFGATGLYFEIVLCSGALSSLELDQLEGYLAWNNSGMVALLPAGHPFKSAPPTK